jgi:hypothetical protein
VFVLVVFAVPSLSCKLFNVNCHHKTKYECDILNKQKSDSRTHDLTPPYGERTCPPGLCGRVVMLDDKKKPFTQYRGCLIAGEGYHQCGDSDIACIGGITCTKAESSWSDDERSKFPWYCPPLACDKPNVTPCSSDLDCDKGTTCLGPGASLDDLGSRPPHIQAAWHLFRDKDFKTVGVCSDAQHAGAKCAEAPFIGEDCFGDATALTDCADPSQKSNCSAVLCGQQVGVTNCHEQCGFDPRSSCCPSGVLPCSNIPYQCSGQESSTPASCVTPAPGRTKPVCCTEDVYDKVDDLCCPVAVDKTHLNRCLNTGKDPVDAQRLFGEDMTVRNGKCVFSDGETLASSLKMQTTLTKRQPLHPPPTFTAAPDGSIDPTFVDIRPSADGSSCLIRAGARIYRDEDGDLKGPVYLMNNIKGSSWPSTPNTCAPTLTLLEILPSPNYGVTDGLNYPNLVRPASLQDVKSPGNKSVIWQDIDLKKSARVVVVNFEKPPACPSCGDVDVDAAILSSDVGGEASTSTSKTPKFKMFDESDCVTTPPDTKRCNQRQLANKNNRLPALSSTDADGTGEVCTAVYDGQVVTSFVPYALPTDKPAAEGCTDSVCYTEWDWNMKPTNFPTPSPALVAEGTARPFVVRRLSQGDDCTKHTYPPEASGACELLGDAGAWDWNLTIPICRAGTSSHCAMNDEVSGTDVDRLLALVDGQVCGPGGVNSTGWGCAPYV